MKKLYPLVVYLFLPSLIFTQDFNSSFEFLDHSSINSSAIGNHRDKIGASEIVAEGILYASHNDRGNMTSIKIASPDNTLHTLFTTPFTSKSKKLVLADNHVKILLYHLFDYDIGPHGFFEIEYDNGTVSIKDFTRDGGLEDFRLYSRELESYGDGGWLLEDYDGLYNVESEDEYELLTEDKEGTIYSHITSEKIFRYLDNHIDLLTDDAFEMNKSFDNEIIEIWQEDDLSLVLTTGTLHIYSTDFEELIAVRELHELVKGQKQIHVADNFDIFMCYSENDISHYLKSDANGIEVLAQNELNAGEEVKSIYFYGDSNYLIGGLTDLPGFQIFFRNLHLSEAPDYLKTNVDIEDYKLTWWTTPNMLEGYKYDVSLSFKNNSDEVIYAFDIFSNQYNSNIAHSYFKYSFSGELKAGESFQLDTTFREYFVIGEVELLCNGANYKFNAEGPIAVAPDYILSDLQAKSENEIALFPNPANDQLNIKTNGSVLMLSIFDSNSKEVIKVNNLLRDQQIDISQLAPGCYFIKMTELGTGRSYGERVVKL